MSPNHGILLGLPVNFFSSDGFLDGLPIERHSRLSAVLSLGESLLWSNDVASIAAGLTTLHKLLKGITLSARLSALRQLEGVRNQVRRWQQMEAGLTRNDHISF